MMALDDSQRFTKANRSSALRNNKVSENAMTVQPGVVEMFQSDIPTEQEKKNLF